VVVALGATVPLLHFTQAGLEITAVGLVIGTLIGTVGARMVRMTAIPQMVALFNGVGGGAAALVAVAELLKFGVHPPFAEVFPSVFSIVIGSVSFAGSMVAFAKLQELMTGTPITYPGQQIGNLLLAATIVGFAVAGLGGGPGHAARLLAARDHRPRLRACGRAGPARGARAGRRAREARGRGGVRDPSRRRSDAGSHERAAGGGERPL